MADRFPGWELSHRFDPAAVRIADRHYSRVSPGTPQFVAPGRNVVLVSPGRDAVWVSLWQRYAKHKWAGAWVCLSLSHWRRRWARIPAWLGTQSVLMTAAWIWPMLEGWWRHGSVAQPDLNTLIAMGVLVLAGIPIVAFWFPFESALLRRINSDSIVTHMMRRRLARKVALIRAHHA